MRRDYDLRVRFLAYQEGDIVYVLDTATVKEKCRKLSPSWKGPSLVVNKLSAHLYRVRTKTTVMLVNHDCMKKCDDRDLPRWLANARERYLAERDLCHVVVHSSTPIEAVSEPGGTPKMEDLPIPRSLDGEDRVNTARLRRHLRVPTRGKTRYCLYRQADDGKLMIQSDRCEEWTPCEECGSDSGRCRENG
ncbi:uncharacterized protein LOC125679916 [Ostrea edulis]|uniref:uncharacterized protein LOC125679916 n=1 Tax=Ostrea edulis TaxID=37623 RepID=UPI0024AF2350|nr:uncharacterized protein LOC125679916 [Ostrea edulis]